MKLYLIACDGINKQIWVEAETAKEAKTLVWEEYLSGYERDALESMEVIEEYDFSALKDQYEELRTLVDGVYELVEIYAPDNTPYNKDWKRKWFETARKHGCSADM